MQVTTRAGLNDSALIRLLARLGAPEVRESRQVTADRLSQWLGWTDALSLSAALDGAPSGASARPAAQQLRQLSAEEREVNRVWTALRDAIAEPVKAFEPDGDFAPHRRRYLARAQAMDTAIGPLRARVRAALAASSPTMARLAGVDVVMEQALGKHERSLLAGVPALLEKHFKRLRKNEEDNDNDGATDGQPPKWLALFRKDLQDVLDAELDFRMQPVEGLLEALRMRPPARHE